MTELPIEEDKYQVFFLKCPVPFPFTFASHTWLVTNSKGELDRWELLDFPDQCETSWSHVHKNRTPPTQGFNMFVQFGPETESRLFATLSGGEDSLAHKMIKFLESEAPNYEYKEKYVLYPGPNSNTFTQWVIDNFPECDVELPKNAYGKDWWENHSG